MDTVIIVSFYTPSFHTYTITRRGTKPVEGTRTRMIDRIATSLAGVVTMEALRTTDDRETITTLAAVTIPGSLTTGIVGIDFTF